MYVCSFVCLSARIGLYQKTNISNNKIHQIFCRLRVNCGRVWSVLVWRQCNTLCTSGFVNDAIFYFAPGKAGEVL